MADPNNPTKQMAFFEAFPETWTEYLTTYVKLYDPGYSKRGPANQKFDLTMSNLNQSHIDAMMYKTWTVPDSIYCAKIVNISIGAFLDGDIAENSKSVLRAAMQGKRKSAMLKTIFSMTPNDQMRFWMYYWGTYTRATKIADEFFLLHKELAPKYPEEAALMKKAYDISFGQSEFEGLGHIDKKKYFKKK